MTSDMMLQASSLVSLLDREDEYQIANNKFLNFLLKSSRTVYWGIASSIFAATLLGTLVSFRLHDISGEATLAVLSMWVAFLLFMLLVYVSAPGIIYANHMNSVRSWLHYNLFSKNKWRDITRLMPVIIIEQELGRACDVLIIDSSVKRRVSKIDMYLRVLNEKIDSIFGMKQDERIVNPYVGSGIEPSVAHVEVRGPGWFDYGSGRVLIPEGQQYRIAIYTLDPELRARVKPAGV